MPNLDPSSVGASFGPGDSLSTSYVSRLANEQSATASAPNLFGGQAQPSYSDLNHSQSASTGYTQGANRGDSPYGEQGAKSALTEEDGQTQRLFSQVYEQVGEDVNQDDMTL